jgi:putative transcriptional regulator
MSKASFTKEGGAVKNRLAELRSANDWTQQELADRVEVSRQTIISLEGGRYNPSILLAFRLARLFDVTIEDLFLYSEEDRDGQS